MVRTRRVGAEWHVGRLGVVPDLRGRGLGRWLLQTAEAAADPACRRFVLSTGAGSRNNIALYRSEGYRPAPLPRRGRHRPPHQGATPHRGLSAPNYLTLGGKYLLVSVK
ncbi:GNAT family N-acetyltransferase [Actinomadura madurae]|nr:GNAT family N-acetyltransferase [Actinomadura madurae]MCP9967846.1 GNAT family N-acetyltransferase [Actinomadura madurae]